MWRDGKSRRATCRFWSREILPSVACAAVERQDSLGTCKRRPEQMPAEGMVMATVGGSPLRRIDWRAIRLYALIALATLLAVELLARIYDWAPRGRDFAAGDRLGLSRYNYSPAGFGDLVPGQDGHWITWFHRPYHVETNSGGLRNTEE